MLFASFIQKHLLIFLNNINKKLVFKKKNTKIVIWITYKL